MESKQENGGEDLATFITPKRKRHYYFGSGVFSQVSFRAEAIGVNYPIGLYNLATTSLCRYLSTTMYTNGYVNILAETVTPQTICEGSCHMA